MLRYPLPVAATVIALTSPLCAGNADAHEIPSGAQYVALGSSYASGPGLPDAVDAGCLRSAHNYPHQVAAAAGLDLIDVSCGGATTADILHTPQLLPSGTVEPVQLDAVTAQTRLVSITIGGNDLDLVGSMISASACAQYLGRIPGLCETVTGSTPPTPSDFDAVENSIAAVVRAVQERAPEATVLLVQYLPALDPSATTCSALAMTPSQAATARATYDGLVSATARAGQQTGATIVSVPDADAHTACADTPWVSGLINPLTSPDGFASVAGSVHPNQAGTDRVAQEVIAQL